MGLKKDRKTTSRPLPRSVLSSLHEPLLDPKDGHGARSTRDVILLQKWKAARNGDDAQLIDLVKLIVREDLAALKAARGTRRYIHLPGGQMQMRSLVPVMRLLKMISVETVKVPLERDGHDKVTSRKKILLEDWFEDYALGSEAADPEAVDDVRLWLAKGAIQRPFRGEVCD